ncbi:uncharacterized protein LOC132697173 [Cylas formicarius]|uniref:uncharacterized protein LOC132697173 n=1 Tax=Cylas formicarius TaxID=197179 RepID=UPI002958C8F2|nr:uncharacterized protein LOC132697173 [Cylas formicarius]
MSNPHASARRVPRISENGTPIEVSASSLGGLFGVWLLSFLLKREYRPCLRDSTAALRSSSREKGSISPNRLIVYAPTLDKSEEEIESFYEDIKQLLKYTKPHDLNIIQGDFNAKVGKGEVIRGVVGPWGLGERNIRGDRLIKFC